MGFIDIMKISVAIQLPHLCSTGCAPVAAKCAICVVSIGIGVNITIYSYLPRFLDIKKYPYFINASRCLLG